MGRIECVKIYSDPAKSNRIFPGKERGKRALMLTYLDSPMAEVFPPYKLLLSISTIFMGKQGLKV